MKTPTLITVEIEEIEQGKKYAGVIEGKDEDNFPRVNFEFSGQFNKLEQMYTLGFGTADEVMEFCELVFFAKDKPMPSDVNMQMNSAFFSPIALALSLLLHVRKIKGETKGTFIAPLFTVEDVAAGLKPASPHALAQYMMRLNHL